MKAFALPNGTKAHFYFSGKSAHDADEAELSLPPRRPTELADLGQDALPVGLTAN